MKRLLLLITAIIIAKIGWSQTDYRNGYIITGARDTLYGLVDYREGAKAYKSCGFKISKSQNTITYEPHNTIGYGFENDKVFQSREISIKGQPSEVVFLEVIVRGPLSLYKFEHVYFIEKNGTDLQQLINETNEVFIRGKKLIRNTNQYIGTLNMLLFDCAGMRSKIQRTKLAEKALTNLVEDYNRCQGATGITFKAKKPWTKAIIGATGGLNISQLSFPFNPGYEHLAGDFEISKSPMIGVSLDLFAPRLSERISFQTDLLYLTSKYYNYTLNTGSSSIERNYVTIELKQFKIPIGIRYTFPKREFTPYFTAGISSTIHVNASSKRVLEVESNRVVNTNENEALAIKNKQVGLWGGCGVLKSINNKLNAFIELRYERTDGIEPSPLNLQGLYSKISNLQIFIGIRTK